MSYEPGPIYSEICQRLETEWPDATITLEDVSKQHEGHAGHRAGGESHFDLSIISTSFHGKNELQRHRMVYATLKPLMNNPIHALTIKAHTPEEAS